MVRMARWDLPPPRKRWGQCFLVDRRAVTRIADVLAPQRHESLLEIGPGRGALTGVLVERAGRIAAIELDPALARLLRARFEPAQLALLEGDVLELDLAAVGPLVGAAPSSRLAVVGNLPYNISKPVASKLVRDRALVARAVLMFQREVADRLVARPSTSAYGPLTVLVGEAYRVERAFDLPPTAFRPAPEVRSTVTRWTPRLDTAFDTSDEAALRACLAASFARRRQTILRNLREALPGGLDLARSLLAAADLDGALRAEAIPPEGFRRLAAVWPTTR